MIVNSAGIQRQLSRLYDARGIIVPSGSLSISPVSIVGPGAHPVYQSQIVGVNSILISAGAAVTGAIGVIVPSTAINQLAVITDLKVYCSTASGWTALLDGPTAEADYPPTAQLATLNTQNSAKGQTTTGFQWAYSSTTTTPALGITISQGGLSNGVTDRSSSTPIVLAPGWGVVVKNNTVNLAWGCDLRVEVFELTTR